MFARYAAIVKNLRGIVYVEELNDYSWKIIKWLIQRFKYRDLGLAPSIVNKFGNPLKDYLKGNPFRELVYPIQNLSKIISLFQGILPYELVESIIFSSLYISPLLVIGNKVHNIIHSIGIDHVYTNKTLDIKDWKLHLRIADYTILDMYEKCVMENIEALKCFRFGNTYCVKKIIEERCNRVKNDKKRYWRIISDEGRPFLTYIDPLNILFNANLISKDTELLEDYASGLAIIPAVHLLITA